MTMTPRDKLATRIDNALRDLDTAPASLFGPSECGVVLASSLVSALGRPLAEVVVDRLEARRPGPNNPYGRSN